MKLFFLVTKVKACHPQALLGNDVIERTSYHKKFSMQLDFELNFQSLVKEATCKTRSGRGMIRYFLRYVFWNELDQV